MYKALWCNRCSTSFVNIFSTKKKFADLITDNGNDNVCFQSNEEVSASPGGPLAESTPKKESNENQSSNATSDRGSAEGGPAVGQLVDIPLQEESPNTTNDVSPKTMNKIYATNDLGSLNSSEEYRRL